MSPPRRFVHSTTDGARAGKSAGATQEEEVVRPRVRQLEFVPHGTKAMTLVKGPGRGSAVAPEEGSAPAPYALDAVLQELAPEPAALRRQHGGHAAQAPPAVF